MHRCRIQVATCLLMAVLLGCTNNPYRPDETATPTLFDVFSTPPTKLDPTSAYYSHEGRLLGQIYEAPFTYHYLKRPYELIPLTAEAIPKPTYYDADGQAIPELDPPGDRVAKAVYTIHLKPGIRYQPHPCFARNATGGLYYAAVTEDDISDFTYPSDFTHQDTRTLRAGDYALQIRRLADPRLASPIFSTIASYILGLDDLQQHYSDQLERERTRRRDAAGPTYNQEQDERSNPIVLDYFAADLPGVTVLDDLTYQITLKRKYPQILYWMCMHFFCPIPEEAVSFYDQPAMSARQFSLNRCPVGTGPYYLKTFKPNEIIELVRNPNYHPDTYPTEGAPGDREAGLLDDAGQTIPFIDRQVMRLEKEALPAWNKFIQGYRDASGIGNDVFDQAIQIQPGVDPRLSGDMDARGIKLVTDVDTTFWYTAFNMLDEVIGGITPERQKLRQAISIALDYNEFLDIFVNGRGILAQGPLPPGIFGYRDGEAGTNPFCDSWNAARDRHERKPIEAAIKLMAEAGYPDGIGPDGKPLTLHYDHSSQSESFFRSYFDWMRRRLALIGVELKDRGTDLSRYRQKRQQGNWQLSSGGWLADYPDPENFLFLFYGPNGKVTSGGANAMNYANPEFDALFQQMESMRNSPERQTIIDQMMTILQRDAPAVWQYHPVSFSLHHRWLYNLKPHQMTYNTIKYRRLDVAERVKRQVEWNRPVYWPIVTLLALGVLGIIPATMALRRREREAKS
ncbi:MAG: ABC transporter substrate-binding protein [Verrucomicrobia bacterium]|nr:ABC transporter substrate-binding protein [Verrucomicrobiota bacterium]